MTRITLRLPEPPSPNQMRRRAYAHSAAEVRAKSKYKRRAWVQACGQHAPTTSPPDPVLVRAHFRLHNLRDPDNLRGSLKYVLDALRTPREGETFPWRRNLHARKGFYVDDGPEHMTLGEVTQEIDRADRGCTVEIVDLEALEAA